MRTLALIALLGSALCCKGLGAEDTVLVLKSRDVPQYNEAVAGFTAQWSATGASPALRVHTLTDSGDDLAGSFTNGNARVRAVVAVGTEAAKWAIKHTNVPVTFCMVANAQRNVISSLSATDAARVAGVALDVPAAAQLREVMALLPAVRRIGVLYDPRNSAVAVGEMKQAVEEAGLQFITQPVTKESEVPEATRLIASRIDVLWAPVDGTVFNSHSAQFVLAQMVERRVPVAGFSENMVKAGALLAPRVNYAMIGRQAAEVLAALLRGEPATLHAPRDFQTVVNGRVLKLVGRSIPPAASDRVVTINDED